MARPLRLEFVGAVQHVMARGNQGQKSLRRGWYVGGEEFRKGLLARVRESLSSRSGRAGGQQAGQRHDQSRAEEMLATGLDLLRLRREDLASLPKGQTEKLVLAWWLYGQTTAKRRWIAEQLAMGYETRVSQAVASVESSRQPAVKQMKRKLTEYGL